MNNFTYVRANDISDVLTLLWKEQTTLVAGGTNLLDLMKYNLVRPDELVDINHMGYDQIEERPEGVRLGALVKNANTAYHPLIEEKYPLLSKAILAGASPQIRNMATNGGNLLQRTRCYYFYDATMPCNKRLPGSGCSAIGGFTRNMAILGASDQCIAVFPSDMCVALSALDAVVNCIGPEGERAIPFSDFHRLPEDTPHLDNVLRSGEMITSIDLPAKGFNEHYSYLKLRDRTSFAFALVSVATAIELENEKIKDIRISLGGVAHKPWRRREAEEALIGHAPSDANFIKAADILLHGAVALRHNSFKVELARRAIVRNCNMALHPESQRPGAQPSL